MKPLSDIHSEIKAFNALKKIKIPFWGVVKIVIISFGCYFGYKAYPYIIRTAEIFDKIESNYEDIQVLKSETVKQSDIENLVTVDDIQGFATKEDVNKAITKSINTYKFVIEHQDANKDIIMDYINQQLEIFKPTSMIPIEPKIYGISPDTIKKKLSI